jgi:hypothetical protein
MASATRSIFVVTPLAPDGGPSTTVNPFNAIITPYSPVDTPPIQPPQQPPLGIWHDPGGYNPAAPGQPWPPEPEVPPVPPDAPTGWLKEPPPGGWGYYNPGGGAPAYTAYRPDPSQAQPKRK